MLRDYNISGRISITDVPILMHMLHFWRVSASDVLKEKNEMGS